MTGFTVTVAPNGARRTKADHPALPMTTNEIAQTARACFAAGAAGIHLHVRDDAGQHSLDAGRYREAIAAITALAPAMDIQVTTEAAGIYSVTEQFACLQQLQPKAASVSIREMTRDMQAAAQLYAFAAEAGIEVQHILYSPKDVAQLRAWFDDGTINAQMRSAIFVLGQYTPQILATPDDLTPFLSAAKGLHLDWSICAFGRHELACAAHAQKLGGHIRIGFENNFDLPNGTPARDNAQLISLAIAQGNSLGLNPTQQNGDRHEPHFSAPQ